MKTIIKTHYKGQLAECVKHFLLNRKILKYEDLTEDQKDGGKPLVPLFIQVGSL